MPPGMSQANPYDRYHIVGSRKFPGIRPQIRSGNDGHEHSATYRRSATSPKAAGFSGYFPASRKHLFQRRQQIDFSMICCLQGRTDKSVMSRPRNEDPNTKWKIFRPPKERNRLFIYEKTRQKFDHAGLITTFVIMRQMIEKCIFGLVLAFCLCSCLHTSSVAMVLDKAEMYLATSPDSAFVELDSLDRSSLRTKELRARHALLYSQALEKVGIEVYNDSIIHIALDYYSSVGDSQNTRKARQCLDRINENASTLTPSDTLKIQNARIIEERYLDKMTLVEKDNRIREIIIISLLLLATMALIIRYVVKRLKTRPGEKAMAVIRQRLSVLDKVIASRISSDDRLYRSSEEEIEVLMADREEFLRSTTIVFEESHPKFIAYLRDKALPTGKSVTAASIRSGSRAKTSVSIFKRNGTIS